MARATVDIDLEEFDNDELLREVERRITSKYNAFDPKHIKRLLHCLVGSDFPKQIKVVSIEDALKMEHFAKVFDKYTSAQLEQLIP